MSVTGEMWGVIKRPKCTCSDRCKCQNSGGNLRFVVSILVAPIKTETREPGRKHPQI